MQRYTKTLNTPNAIVQIHGTATELTTPPPNHHKPVGHEVADFYQLRHAVPSHDSCAPSMQPVPPLSLLLVTLATMTDENDAMFFVTHL